MREAHTRAHTFALVFIACFVIVVGGGVLVATVLWTRIGEPFKGYSSAETFVEIPQGSGPAEIRRRLIGAGVVATSTRSGRRCGGAASRARCRQASTASPSR